MAIALPYNFANGQTDADLNKVQANFTALANKFGQITDGDIGAGALISPLKVGASIDGNVNLRQDIQQLNSQLSAFAGQQLGGYNPWNEMLPVIGATPISATGTTDLKVTIAGGGTIKMLGHNFVTKGITALGTDGKANGVAMDAESVYALRLTSGAPPTGESAHVQEGGIDTLAVHFELVKLTASRFIRDTVSSVTSSTVFTFNNASLQGARIRFLNGTLANTEFSVPWTSGSTVYLAASVGGSPAVGDKVLVNLDSLSVRNAETPGTGAGASSPTSAFIAIVATMASGVAPAIILQQNRGGTYNYGRSLIAETDWSAEMSADGGEHTLTWTKPVDGARLKSISGWIALADSATPARVAMRPLCSGSPADGTVTYVNGMVQEYWRESGLELRLLGDGVGVTCHYEGWPTSSDKHANIGGHYDRMKVKVIAEYMP